MVQEEDARLAVENLSNNSQFKDFEVKYVEHPILGKFPEKRSGNFAITYHVQNKKTGKEHAFRLWKKEITGIIERTRHISNYLYSHRSTYFVGYELYQNSITVNNVKNDALLMDWISGQTLFNYISEICKEGGDSNSLLNLSLKLKNMFRWMHSNDIVHGDLQHENIMIMNGDVVLCDYDSVYVPSMGEINSITSGLPGYQHPLRTNGDICECSKYDDYLAEIIIYSGLLALSIDPTLWNHEDGSDNYFILTNEDILNISNNDFTSLEQFRVLKASNEPQTKIINEINQLVDLLIYNLTCVQYEKMKPLPGIDATYCQICGSSIYDSYNYCPICGSNLALQSL